ncbi:MAG: DUF2752 domain-containing protein [Spirochaetales bacterium]|nr:DUF2752 domain-containing protein [Spirochaetales bacterium]
MKIEVVPVQRSYYKVCLVPLFFLLVWGLLIITTLYLSNKFNKPVTLCVFKKVTGIACPTCGATRGVLAFFSGHPIQMIKYNPFFFTLGVLWSLKIVIEFTVGKHLILRTSRPEKIAIWTALTVLFSINWAYVIIYVK